MSAGVPMRRAGMASVMFLVCGSQGHGRGDASPLWEQQRLALFYASDLSSYMTGTVVEVTGGRDM